MSMARTAPIHLSHNILHMTRTASGAPRSACSEKTDTNGHMSCWSQTHTTSSDPVHTHRIGIAGQHFRAEKRHEHA